MIRHILLLLSCFTLFSSGCAHHQLKHNTIHHAETLTDLYERQVLNNLARFVENPESIPHFEIPTSGGTNVNDTVGFTAGPVNTFREAFGLNGNRTQLSSWTLQPVTNPARIRRMRCAFQRAVGHQFSNCEDCCQLEQSFISTPNTVVAQVFDENGKRNVDKITGKAYAGVTYLSEVKEYLQDGTATDNTVEVYRPVSSGQGDPVGAVLTRRPTVVNGDDTGREIYYMEYSSGVVTDVTRSPYDCNSECAVQPCWIKSAPTSRIARSNGKGRYGSYRGTHVWVPENARAEFAKLVLTVLEYATTDPAPELTKDVTLYLNHDGSPATPETASQVIRRSISATSNNIALESGKIAEDPDETVVRSAVNLLSELKLHSKDPTRTDNTVAALKALKNLDGVSSVLKEELETCIGCAEGQDPEAIEREIKVIRSLPRSMKRMNLMRSGEANREANRIQRNSPKRSSLPTGDNFLREFSLQQQFLLPDGQ